MKKPFFWRLLFILALFLSTTASGFTQSLELNGKAGLLMDAKSGNILFEYNIDEALPMASITKIMTLVLVLEAVDQGRVSLTDLVTTSKHAASMGGSQVWLDIGEQLPLKEIIYAIAVGSANDAAVAVAEYLAGSEQAFVAMMNARAQELELSSTEFSNASGLPPSQFHGGAQVMSARDVANLTRHALSVPLMLDFVSTYDYTMRSQSTKRPQLWNYNKLLRRYQGVDGMKTGFTTEAGYCLAATAKRDDLRLIAVVLGSVNDANRENDVRKLIDFGFRKYTSHVILSQGTKVGEIQIRQGEPEIVAAVLTSDLAVTVLRGDESKITTEIRYSNDLNLPLVKGTPIGVIQAVIDDDSIGSAEITIAVDVKRGSFPKLIVHMANAMIDSLLEF